MRIVIDLQGAQGNSRFRGIGRYSLSLAQAMARNRGEHEVFIVLNRMLHESLETIRDAFDGILPPENIKIWHSVAPAHAHDLSNEWRITAGELLREAFIESLNPDVVHIASFFDGWGDSVLCSINKFSSKIPVAVTYYDAIPLMQPEAYLADANYRKFYLDKTDNLKQAAAFLAISESSKSECIQYLEQPADKVFNIAAAIDSDYFKPIVCDNNEKKRLFQKFGVDRPFIMYSGATDSRKNHLRLIKAFSLLPDELRKQYQLVFVGGLPDDHRQKFRDYAQLCNVPEEDFVITGHVSDRELLYFYNLCSLFVFPSIHEGFGLPALEAMSCGAATIGANTTSVPEVIGKKEALFNPLDADAMAQKIIQVLQDDDFRMELQQHGLSQAKKFSWDISANKAWKALEFIAMQPKTHTANTDLRERVIRQMGAIDALQHLIHTDLIQLSESITHNFPKVKPQLFIDITELARHDNASGIQRVVKNIVDSLLKKPPMNYSIQPVYIRPDESQFRYANAFCVKYFGGNELKEDTIISFASGDVFLGLDLNFLIDREFVLDNLRYGGVQLYFVAYDILPVLMPQYFVDGIGEVFKPWIRMISRSDGLICISRAVADEMIDILPFINQERKRSLPIGWFHLGADLSAGMASKGIPENGLDLLNKLKARPTFLMVGTLEPRKGHMEALQEFEKLWIQGIDISLVIVGKHGWKVELLSDLLKTHHEYGKRLFWIEKASDEFLEQIYAHTDCLIAASYGEGFGLPLIEAAQKKIPLIVRDIPVFREVAGVHAVYFDGRSTTLSQAVQKWVKDKQEGKVKTSAEMPWITWQQSAEQLMDNVIGKKWYSKWQPEQDKQYWFASNGQFGTLVGERKGITIESTGVAGVLLYGPYISLAPQRQYCISLSMPQAILHNDATCIVSLMSNQRQLLSKEFKCLNKLETFVINTPVDGLEQFEIVVEIKGDVRLVIDKITLADVGEALSTPVATDTQIVLSHQADRDQSMSHKGEAGLVKFLSKWLGKRI